jgi:hypothetical protein
VRVEEIAAVLRQGQAPLVVAKVNDSDEALIAQVVERLVVDVEVAFGHDPEGADGGQRAAILGVQFVDVVTNHDQLALLASRQVEIPHQPLAGVLVTVPFVVHALAAVLTPVTVARVISRIEHGCPPDMALRLGCP